MAPPARGERGEDRGGHALPQLPGQGGRTSGLLVISLSVSLPSYGREGKNVERRGKTIHGDVCLPPFHRLGKYNYE